MVRGPIGLKGLSLGNYRLRLDPQFRSLQSGLPNRGPLGQAVYGSGPPRLSFGRAKHQLDLALRSKGRHELSRALRSAPVAAAPPLLAKLRGKPGDGLRIVFGPVSPEEALLFCLAENLDALATDLNMLLLLDQIRTDRTTFWLVYENDGDPPYNPGSGSDQWRTARLSMFVTFDKMRTGLTKLGVTVIDMRTPRGYLNGQPFDPASTYHTAAGPYSGISSIDFAVTVKRTGLIKVEILGSVGIDSTEWGKLVQDFIHEKVSNSSLFPWPRDISKPFAEIGVAALVTPKWVLSQGDVIGISYKGSLVFDAKAVMGTHRSQVTAGARVVLSTALVKTKLGNLRAEYSPIGVFGRGFLRYNDGREAGHFGVEGGVTSSFMLKIGRFGIGLEGEITSSTDPAAQTGNPAGSAPVINPLSAKTNKGETTGGPAGHHGIGRLILTWTF